MRIPYDVIRDGLGAVNRAADNMAAAQRQMSTGRRLNSIGDDPLGAHQAVGQHATLGAIDAYSRAVSAASPRLAAADAVFAAVGDKLTAAIQAGLGAKGSNTTPASRTASAAQVASLRDALLADFNSTENGTYLFSGTASTDAPYAQSGGTWVYQGNADTAKVEVGRGRTIAVTFDGQAIAKGTDPTDVFTVLDDLAMAINAGNDPAIATAVAGLERAFDRTLRAQGRLGADERGLDEASMRLAGLKRGAEARRSTIEDANMAEAITNLTQAETNYRAALASVSTMERISLLDYLR